MKGALWHTDQWLLSGGGWDGDAEAIHRPCNTDVQVKWGRTIRDLQEECALHESLCPYNPTRPEDDP